MAQAGTRKSKPRSNRALFVTPEPIRREKILQVFGERSREEAEAALDRVLDRYDHQGEPGWWWPKKSPAACVW